MVLNPFSHAPEGVDSNPCGFTSDSAFPSRCHCPPSHETFYFQLRWVIMDGLSQNTDNKLHICDNHLGEREEAGLGKSLNGNAETQWTMFWGERTGGCEKGYLLLRRDEIKDEIFKSLWKRYVLKVKWTEIEEEIGFGMSDAFKAGDLWCFGMFKNFVGLFNLQQCWCGFT